MDDLIDTHALRFMALGNPIRLAILRLLVQGHPDGTAAGAIQTRVGIPASTLSHHLACLAEAGLVLVAREGTILRYRPDFQVLRDLTQYLWEDCCRGGRTSLGDAPSQACCTPAARCRQPKT